VNEQDQFSRRAALGIFGTAVIGTMAFPSAVRAATKTAKQKATTTTKKPTSTALPTTTAAPTTVKAAAPTAGPKGTLKVGGGWVFVTWNPHDGLRAGTGPIIYWRPVFDTLFTQDEALRIKPGLATKWTFNEDGLSMTIREGVAFSDGSPLTADVVVANIKQMLKDPRAGGIAQKVSNVTSPGPLQVRIETNAPVPELLRQLASQRGMMVASSLLGTSKVNDTPIGTGPYVYDAGASVPGQKLVYKLNEKYWNKAAQTAQKLEISILPDPGARLNALLSGQIDVTYFDNALSNQAIKAGLKSASRTGAQYSIFIFDRRGSIVPALGNRDVREALSWAVDRQAFAAATLPGIGRPAVQPFLPGEDGYDQRLDSAYGFDREWARSLLAKGGYPDGFSFDLPVALPFQQPIEILVAAWREIGVRVRLVPVDISEYGPRGTSGQFPVLFVPVIGSNPYDGVNALIDVRGGLNPNRLSEPKALEALDNLARAFDETKDGFLGARAIKEAMDVGAFFTFAIGQKHAFYRDGVTGVKWNVDEPGVNPIGITPKQ
jgi:peptide/nickel transport system substrate-binding protein